MAISFNTLKLLGSTITTEEELEAALAAARTVNEDWEIYYAQTLEAQRPIKDRFREFKANLKLEAATNGTAADVDPAEVLAHMTAKERFKKHNTELKHEHYISPKTKAKFRL